MIDHLFLPDVDLTNLCLHQNHRDWLVHWLEEADPHILDGDVSTSMCLQTAIIEIVVHGDLQRDWIEVFEDFLTDNDGIPLAYSEEFGKRLHKFDDQWRQHPVYASHARWWIENLMDGSTGIIADHLRDMMQDNGWVYNTAVSPTQLKTRMKSEFTMSLAMSLDILKAEEINLDRFVATLSTYPSTDYLSSEYFRSYGLSILDKSHLAPAPVADIISNCEVDKGYCDFNVDDKKDDYMGTDKRTERDDAVQSPIATLHARFLAKHHGSDLRETVKVKAREFGNHLAKEPMDIPAFQIRDLPHPFGTSLSPLEVIGGSFLISLAN